MSTIPLTCVWILYLSGFHGQLGKQIQLETQQRSLAVHTEGWVGVSLNLIKKSVVWLWTWCSLLLQWWLTWYLFWLISSGIWLWFCQLLPTCGCCFSLPPSIYFNIFSHLRFCVSFLYSPLKKISAPIHQLPPGFSGNAYFWWGITFFC